MFKKIQMSLFILGVFISGSSFAAATIEARVVNVVIGEIDPFVIGDTCLIFVEYTKKGVKKLYGLNTDFETCEENESYYQYLKGKTVTIERKNVSLFEKRSEIEVLKDFDQKAFYLNLNSPENIKVKH